MESQVQIADTASALAFTLSNDDINMTTTIETIRSSYDKAFVRWPPHINFVFPFVSVEQFPDTKAILETDEVKQILAEINVMGLTFIDVQYFDQKKFVTFHLKPDKTTTDILEKLHTTIIKKVVESFPFCESKRKDFHPHLTLGQSLKTTWLSGLEQTIKQQFTFPLKVKFNGLSHLHRSVDSSDRMISY